MKTAVVFPIFWGREKNKVYEEGDFFYDHPTPVDGEGTAPALFASMELLRDQDFDVLVVSGANAESYRERVQGVSEKLLGRLKTGRSVYAFSYFQLEKLKKFLAGMGRDDLGNILSLTGYSNLRNLCLAGANLLDCEIAVSVDDDCVFVLPEYISLIKRTLKTEFEGKEILALCGPYLTGENQIYLPVKPSAVSVFWDNIAALNEAFRKYIVEGPRRKEVHFAIMGNIAVHREFFMRVPLDPHLPRGEDSDWVMNGDLLGYRFVMDRELLIKHLPPPRPYPSWRPLREDVFRFQYIRKKIAGSYDGDGIHRLRAETYDPFPGRFFKDDLLEKVTHASFALAQEYLAGGDPVDALEALRTIYLARYEAVPDYDPFSAYLQFQKKWEQVMGIIAENRAGLRKLLWGG